MQTRRFGRTGHQSTVAIFGAAAFSQVTQSEADAAMEQVIAAGVNHIDVAPSYGQAEERVGPWMKRERSRFFLGCKTLERTRDAATAELHRSLQLLQTETLDLWQIHAITSFEQLDEVTRRGGALEALIAARAAGLTSYLGITGHGVDCPAVFLEALRRFDFDSVLFPINFVQYANPYYRQNTEELLSLCRTRDVGVMVIKSITKGPWGDKPHSYNTWYEPFDDAEDIQQTVNFVLSQDVTGICTAGDCRILPWVLRACENFTPLSRAEQEAVIARAREYLPLFA
jgi:aryl-alcohol dehydrogenase-like predicted oxidoreductase